MSNFARVSAVRVRVCVLCVAQTLGAVSCAFDFGNVCVQSRGVDARLRGKMIALVLTCASTAVGTLLCK